MGEPHFLICHTRLPSQSPVLTTGFLVHPQDSASLSEVSDGQSGQWTFLSRWLDPCGRPSLFFIVSPISYDGQNIYPEAVCVCVCVCAHSVSRVWLCDPMDCSLPGSSLCVIFGWEYCRELPFPDPGIEPESPAMAGRFLTTEPPGKLLSKAKHTDIPTSQCVCVCAKSLHLCPHNWTFGTPWTVACQAPVSMGCSRQEHWSGLPCPPPGDLPSSGVKPPFLESPALTGMFFTTRRGLPTFQYSSSKFCDSLWFFPDSSQILEPTCLTQAYWLRGRMVSLLV